MLGRPAHIPGCVLLRREREEAAVTRARSRELLATSPAYRAGFERAIAQAGEGPRAAAARAFLSTCSRPAHSMPDEAEVLEYRGRASPHAGRSEGRTSDSESVRVASAGEAS